MGQEVEQVEVLAKRRWNMRRSETTIQKCGKPKGYMCVGSGEAVGES